MSVTVDYFFNSEKNLEELARELNSLLGCSLAPYQGDEADYFGRFLAMEFSLSKHPFENDGECNFEEYKYYLYFRTPAGDANLRNMQIPAMGLVAYALFRRNGLTGMLVYDGQILLAKYEERINPQNDLTDLYDLVSSEFVTFPHHLSALSSRAPDDFWRLVKLNPVGET